MNRFKTTLLLGGLTAFVLAVGYYFGGQQGALIARNDSFHIGILLKKSSDFVQETQQHIFKSTRSVL